MWYKKREFIIRYERAIYLFMMWDKLPCVLQEYILEILDHDEDFRKTKYLRRVSQQFREKIQHRCLSSMGILMCKPMERKRRHRKIVYARVSLPYYVFLYDDGHCDLGSIW